MQKLILALLIITSTTSSYASKLSEYLHKMEAQQKASEQREWSEDMDFGNLTFHLERRFTNDHAERCREYSFMSRVSRYRSGTYVVCDSRY